MQIQRVWTS